MQLPTRPTFWSEIRLEGASGGLPAQEFVGLDADPSHWILSGWPGLDGTIFLRSWPEAKAARLVLHANAEMRFRLVPDLGVRGPGIWIRGGSLAPFLELAHPWGGRSAGLFRERTRAGFGMEARLAGRLGPLPVVPTLAWGHGIGSNAPNGSWSWRLATSLPFSMPLRPPGILRMILGGALIEEGRHDPAAEDLPGIVPTGTPRIPLED
jgi:hypothetical protein